MTSRDISTQNQLRSIYKRHGVARSDEITLVPLVLRGIALSHRRRRILAGVTRRKSSGLCGSLSWVGVSLTRDKLEGRMADSWDHLVGLLSGGLYRQSGVSRGSRQFLEEGVAPLPPVILLASTRPTSSLPLSLPPTGVATLVPAPTPAPAPPAAPLTAPDGRVSCCHNSPRPT